MVSDHLHPHCQILCQSLPLFLSFLLFRIVHKRRTSQILQRSDTFYNKPRLPVVPDDDCLVTPSFTATGIETELITCLADTAVLAEMIVTKPHSLIVMLSCTLRERIPTFINEFRHIF